MTLTITTNEHSAAPVTALHARRTHQEHCAAGSRLGTLVVAPHDNSGAEHAEKTFEIESGALEKIRTSTGLPTTTSA